MPFANGEVDQQAVLVVCITGAGLQDETARTLSLYGQTDSIAFVRLGQHGHGGRRHWLNRTFGVDGDDQVTGGLGAVHHRKARFKFIAGRDLIRQGGAEFGRLIHGKMPFAQPHAVGGGEGHGEDAPPSEVIGQGKADRRLAVGVRPQGGIPVADEFE